MHLPKGEKTKVFPESILGQGLRQTGIRPAQHNGGYGCNLLYASIDTRFPPAFKSTAGHTALGMCSCVQCCTNRMMSVVCKLTNATIHMQGT